LAKVAHVYENENGPWSCMLNQTNISNNNNKFYTAQLLQADDKSSYWCWFRWGRVGNKGQSKAEEFESLEEAKTSLEKKFKDKTGNVWKDRSKFKSFPGKYVIIDIDYGDDSDNSGTEKKKKKKSNKSEEDDIPSSLSPAVKDLVEFICDTKSMQTSMIEMNYDFTKMPLGKLKKVTIDRALAILTKIEKSIKAHKQEKLIDLSNQFYTLVPHYFGMKMPPVINSIKMVKKKQQMLEELGNMQIAKKVMDEAKEKKKRKTQLTLSTKHSV